LPKTGVGVTANGATFTLAYSAFSARFHSAQPVSPDVTDACAASVAYSGLSMAEKFDPSGAAGPDRNPTFWVGTTALGTQQSTGS
jgi:hypothetical protein